MKRRKIRSLVIAIVMLSFVSIQSISAQSSDGLGFPAILENGNAVLSISINLLTTGLFAARIFNPSLAPALGTAVQLTAIPALGFAIYNISQDNEAFSYVPSLLWTAFIVSDVLINSILKVEFRNPTDLRILVPFLTLFYSSTVSLWASTWDNGIIPYIVAGGTYLTMASFSIAGRIHEVRGGN
jgi:hypothetical protein